MAQQINAKRPNSYKASLRTMKNGALLIAGLQKMSRFFAFCALTWATVVLLGGFASVIKLLDFYLISILLLLEGMRFSIIEVCSKLLSKTILRRPERDPTESRLRQQGLDFVGQIFSCLLAIASLAFTIVRIIFGISGVCPLSEKIQSHGSDSNITPSLYIFYALIIFNAGFAIGAVLCRPFVRCSSSEDSLLCYHEEVYQRAILDVGMVKADEFDTLEFAFKKLGKDWMQQIDISEFMKRNKQLIQYIYQQNSLDLICRYLRSHNMNEQLVAAQLPGFWKDENGIEDEFRLFWALQRRLYDENTVAEAAAHSIGELAKAWKNKQHPFLHPFLANDPSKINATNVVDTLVDLQVQSIKPTLIHHLIALERCCGNSQVLQHIYRQYSGANFHSRLLDMITGTKSLVNHEDQNLSRPERLCRKLLIFLNEHGEATTIRTKMYAGRVLMQLLGGELQGGEAKERFKTMVGNINPAEIWAHESTHEDIFEAVRDALNPLRAALDLPPYPTPFKFVGNTKISIMVQ